jgi:hypothetical protein
MTLRTLGTFGFALSVLAAVTASPPPARAATMYSYVGYNFTDLTDVDPPQFSFNMSMNVSGSFTLLAPLAANLSSVSILPVIFSFSDGRNTITNMNVGLLDNFTVSTNSIGQIIDWQIEIGTNSDLHTLGQQYAEIHSFSGIQDKGLLGECVLLYENTCNFAEDFATVSRTGINWSVKTVDLPTPLPASLPLFASGLGGLGLLGWRRKRKAAALAA